MLALDLNLASRPFRNNTLIWVSYGAAVGLLVWFTVWNVGQFREQGQTLADLRAEVSGVERELAELDLREQRAQQKAQEYDLPSLEVRAEKANDIIQWKAFSWTRLFNQLELLQPFKVKMLSIHPVFYAAERRQVEDETIEGSVPVRVEGIALNLKTFLALERELLLDPHFDRVEPVANTTLQNGETKFELNFLYFPDGMEAWEPPRIEPVDKLPSNLKEWFERYGSASASEEGAAEEPAQEPAQETAG